ncbi:hypothetical protein KTE49_20705 [Burkholderia multivorans]|nr:hypothetical protein [Burkholderia multivorans]MBU9532859.1 hypothetical protein [Burkholderia multivorans]MBU9549939.1 hypothetical protein [Burkholderia multivorans]MBU9648300.1 hypothetical protein [Burkholderia multivorans]
MQMSDRKLIAIQPQDLRDVWPSIREQMHSIKPGDGAIPEEVFAACVTGGALLFLLEIDGERVGWMVIRPLGRDFHIWLLWARNGFDVMSVFRADLMQMARTAGSRMLTFGSNRRGWERVTGYHGFKVRSIIYECPLDGLTTENTTP